MESLVDIVSNPTQIFDSVLPHLLNELFKHDYYFQQQALSLVRTARIVTVHLEDLCVLLL